jgi:cell pole-organizing protein PopZ
MNQPARAQEPSMEEILASIRRIIADDDATKTAQRPPEPPRAEAPPPAMQQVHAEPLPPPPPPAPPPRIEPELPPPVVEEPVSFQQETVEDQAADILDLTESMTAAAPEPESAPSAAQFRTIDGNSDVGFDDAQEAEPAPAPFPPAPPRANDHDDQGRLISGATGAAVDSAFNALAQTVLSQNARTLEDLVREMLRPMLKTWLDDNLPGMVERMVRAEIERVSRGRPG